MAIKCDQYNNVCVLTPGGDFVGEDTSEAQRFIEEFIEKKHIVDFVIDFEKSAFIDSTGLSTLLWAKRRCEDLFGQFKVAAMDENCRKILEITRLVHRLECHQSLEGALKTMR